MDGRRIAARRRLRTTDRFSEIVGFALQNEITVPGRTITKADMRYPETGAYRHALGVVRSRGSAAGVVIQGGRTVAKWGDTSRVDMALSVSKSYLALVAGVTVDAGLIELDDPVSEALETLIDTEVDSHVTWRRLLEQTSEWQGTLWGKPWFADQADRLAPAGTGPRWAYSDVRTNLLALALLGVWRRPVPDVLRERVMDPIGASRTWQWHGFANSFVEVDGRRIRSVTAGLWGGGLWTSVEHDARIGELVLAGGSLHRREILSRAWVLTMVSPNPANKNYGYLWWINTERGIFPDAPSTGVCALGGDLWHMIWVDRPAQLVVVSRWGADQNALLARIYETCAGARCASARSQG